MEEKILNTRKNGMAALLLTLLGYVASIALFIYSITLLNADRMLLGVPLLILSIAYWIAGIFLFCGLKVLQPQAALVILLHQCGGSLPSPPVQGLLLDFLDALDQVVLLFEHQVHQQRKIFDDDGQHSKQPGKAKGQYKHHGGPPFNGVPGAENDQRVGQLRQRQEHHHDGNACTELIPGIGIQRQTVHGKGKAPAGIISQAAIKFQIGHF